MSTLCDSEACPARERGESLDHTKNPKPNFLVCVFFIPSTSWPQVSSETSGSFSATDSGHESPKATTAAERERILSALERTILFNNTLNEDKLEEIIGALRVKDVNKGEEVIRQGEKGDFFYIIDTGNYVAIKNGNVVFTYRGEGAFGELALMHNSKRMASVKALTSGKLWALDRRTFRSIIIIANKQMRQRNTEILRSIDAFQGLTNEQVQSVADCLDLEVYHDGHTIIHEGDRVHSESKFFILIKGNVTALRTIQGNKIKVKSIVAPGFFGEMAFVEGSGTRFADCVAQGKVEVLTMTRSAFERLLGPIEQALKREVNDYKEVTRKLENAEAIKVEGHDDETVQGPEEGSDAEGETGGAEDGNTARNGALGGKKKRRRGKRGGKRGGKNKQNGMNSEGSAAQNRL